MQEARFLEKQKEVTISTVNGQKQYTLCLNERKETRRNDYSEEETLEFVYDFNQFTDNTVNEQDVLTNPAKYIDYVSKKAVVPEQKTIDTRVSELEQRQAVAEQALQEALLMIMDGVE